MKHSHFWYAIPTLLLVTGCVKVGLVKEMTEIWQSGIKTYHDNGNLESETYYFNEEGNGMTNTYYETGELRSKAIFSNNGAKSKVQMFYPDGTLKREFSLVDFTELDGVVKSYHQNERLHEIRYYSTGKLVDYYEIYSKDGWLEERGIYQDSLQSETDRLVKVSKYYANGNLKENVNLINGVAQGIAEHYHSDGWLQERRSFHQGVATNDYERYNRQGLLIEKSECIDEDCGTHRKTTFNGSGQVAAVERYVDDFLDGWVEIYEHGILKLKLYNRRGVQTGEYQFYYDNGNVREKGYRRNDRLDGLQTRYYQNGQIMSKTMFKNGVRHGIRESYAENGTLIQKIRYVNDKPVETLFPPD